LIGLPHLQREARGAAFLGNQEEIVEESLANPGAPRVRVHRKVA
jgi:hypothetical protein